jgi:predicted GNAT superfamily acetyltransferase
VAGAGGVGVRDAIARDHPAVLALNNGAVPHVNALDDSGFAWLAEHATYFRVAADGDGIAGFVMMIENGTEYWSANYAWFSSRYDAFLYLDRVVVASRAQRSGIGRLLYDDVTAFARGWWPRIMLEVNLRPPNPVSVAFHEHMGFREVGTREYDENAVLMMELEL